MATNQERLTTPATTIVVEVAKIDGLESPGTHVRIALPAVVYLPTGGQSMGFVVTRGRLLLCDCGGRG